MAFPRLKDPNTGFKLKCNHENTKTRKQFNGLLRAFVSSWLHLRRHYSARSALSSGARSAALVATIDAISPATKTDTRSSQPPAVIGSRPPRSANAGATATSAQKVPIASPHASSSTLSTSTTANTWPLR